MFSFRGCSPIAEYGTPEYGTPEYGISALCVEVSEEVYGSFMP